MNNIRVTLPHNHGTVTRDFLETMNEQTVFENVAETFDILSDSSRLKILWLLCHSEECVTNIAAVVNMSSPAVSHHLRLLKQAGLLDYRKSGKEAYYTLAKNPEAEQIHKIIDSIFDIKCNI